MADTNARSNNSVIDLWLTFQQNEKGGLKCKKQSRKLEDTY